MDIHLIYKDSSLTFNVTPLMPISYLRALAHKTFKIPDFLLLLSYGNERILKSENNTLLKDYFKNSSSVTIKVSEIQPQLNLKNLFENNNNNENKMNNSINNKNIEYQNKRNFLKNFDNKIRLTLNNVQIRRNKNKSELGKNKTTNYIEKEKCQECLNNNVNYYCRDDNIFLCHYCFDKKHNKHKAIEIEKNNIEQCFYIYQKILIEKIKAQENSLYKLSIKIKEHEDKKYTEELIHLLQKIFEKEQKILNFYPSLPFEKFLEKDYSEIKREIYEMKKEINSKNLYSYKDKIEAFQILRKKDFEINDNQTDINAFKIKIKFSQIIKEVINQIKTKLDKFYLEMKKILEDNKINPVGLAEDLKVFMSKQMKKYKINIDESKEEIEEEKNNDFYEKKKKKKNKKKKKKKKKKTRNRCITERDLSVNTNNQKLPILNSNNSFSTISNNSSINSSSKNIKKDILKLDVKSDYSDSSDESNINNKNVILSPIDYSSKIINNKGSIYALDEINKKKKKSNVNYISFNHSESIKKNKGIIKNNNIINDNEKKNINDEKRGSIRLSIFLQNKHKINTFDVMKVKKKKKKHL